MKYLLVMIGGFLGAISRYGVAVWIDTESFPVATFLVNVTGCFLLAFLLTWAAQQSPGRQAWALLFGTGFLGAFTTFSTFSLETLLLMKTGVWFQTICYGIGSIGAGILFAAIGFWAARTICQRNGEREASDR